MHVLRSASYEDSQDKNLLLTSSACPAKANFFCPVLGQKTRAAQHNSNNQLSIPGAVLLFSVSDSNLFYKHLCSSMSSSPIQPKPTHVIYAFTQIFFFFC